MGVGITIQILSLLFNQYNRYLVAFNIQMDQISVLVGLNIVKQSSKMPNVPDFLIPNWSDRSVGGAVFRTLSMCYRIDDKDEHARKLSVIL